MALPSSTRAKRATSPRPEANTDAHLDTRVLDALPIACAIFHGGECRRATANRQFSEAFGDPSDLAALFAQFNGTDATTSSILQGSRELLHAVSGRWYEITVRPLGAGGDAALFSATDISARQQSLSAHKSEHEKLLFTSRTMSVGEMATTLAHELNQPLAAIVNYLGVSERLLEHENIGNERIVAALAHAREQAEHASQVITRLREFVRAREPRREPHAPAELVATVLRLLTLEAQKHEVRVDVDIPPDLPPVHADRIMIEQVLLNLSKNAIEAMRDAPLHRRRLDLRALVNLDEQIEFRVADHGCGLADGAAEQLFTPFFTTKPDGMGIGLAICRSIVEYHEGRLYFERNSGGGSVFVFTLPPERT